MLIQTVSHPSSFSSFLPSLVRGKGLKIATVALCIIGSLGTLLFSHFKGSNNSWEEKDVFLIAPCGNEYLRGHFSHLAPSAIESKVNRLEEGIRKANCPSIEETSRHQMSLALGQIENPLDCKGEELEQIPLLSAWQMSFKEEEQILVNPQDMPFPIMRGEKGKETFLFIKLQNWEQSKMHQIAVQTLVLFEGVWKAVSGPLFSPDENLSKNAIAKLAPLFHGASIAAKNSDLYTLSCH